MKSISLGLSGYFLTGVLTLSHFAHASQDPEWSTKVLKNLETQRFLNMYEHSEAVKAYENSQLKDLYFLQRKNFEYIYKQEQLAEEKKEFKEAAKEELQNKLKLIFRGEKDQPLYKSLSEVDFETDTLNYKLFKKFVNAESCQHSLQYFIGCAESLKLILQLTKQINKPKSEQIIVATNPNALSLTANKKLKLRESVVDFFHILATNNTNQDISEIILEKYSFSELRKNEFRGYQNLFVKKDKIVSLLNYIESVNGLNSIDEKSWADILSQFFINAYDPHSEVISYAKQKEFKKGKEFEGVGITFSKRGPYYVIQDTTNQGPAQRAGVEKNSILTKINGESVSELSLDQLLHKLQGEAGSALTIEVTHNNISKVYSLIRERVTPNAIDTEIFSFNEKKYLKIQFSHFMRDDLCVEIRKAILDNTDAEGIILDIRDNGGGLVSNAGCIAEMFLPPSSIYFISKEASKVSELRTRRNPIFHNKLAVLVNSRSASASEIISLAFKDYQRGLLVGQKTYGKGSMQNPYAIELANQLFIKLTVSLFYAPSGYTNQTTGIQPDIEVTSSEKEDEESSLREADLYYFPIQPDRIQTSFVKPTHRLEVNTDCMTQINVEKKYKSLSITDPMKDMFVLKALAGMECLK